MLRLQNFKICTLKNLHLSLACCLPLATAKSIKRLACRQMLKLCERNRPTQPMEKCLGFFPAYRQTQKLCQRNKRPLLTTQPLDKMSVDLPTYADTV